MPKGTQRKLRIVPQQKYWMTKNNELRIWIIKKFEMSMINIIWSFFDWLWKYRYIILSEQFFCFTSVRISKKCKTLDRENHPVKVDFR